MKPVPSHVSYDVLRDQEWVEAGTENMSSAEVVSTVCWLLKVLTTRGVDVRALMSTLLGQLESGYAGVEEIVKLLKEAR